MLQEIMLQDTPIEQREQILRDSCDQIVERSYTKKFDNESLTERKNELANVAIQITDLESELAGIRADFKGRIKPLEERQMRLLDEIKSSGEWVTNAEVYKFVDEETKMVGFYDGSGHLLESRPMNREERQRNIFRMTRATGTEG